MYKLVKAGTQEYFYLLSLFNLAKQGINKIGHDNGFKNGYKFLREFKLSEDILNETKLSKASAEFTRSFKIIGKDTPTPSFFKVCDWEH